MSNQNSIFFFKLFLIYIFILADAKYGKNKKKDEEIKRILEEKDEEIKRKDENFKKEIYKISKTAWDDFVGEDFEIENGVLGLERDIYLNIVKFLDSHTLRKV
jgi:hypothetical protein